MSGGTCRLASADIDVVRSSLHSRPRCGSELDIRGCFLLFFHSLRQAFPDSGVVEHRDDRPSGTPLLQAHCLTPPHYIG